jgi:lysophospholipase L1-like esterase
MIPMRRIVRTLAGVVVFVLITLAVAEEGLRLAAALTHGRQAPWRPGSTRHILCVGDSHAYGAGVTAEEALPGQLQRLLDEKFPGVFSVLNYGIPGMSSTEVLHRLPEQVARLAPEAVVVWCGGNNVWNRHEAEPVVGWRDKLAAAVDSLRVVRFVRVWRRDLRIQGELDGIGKPFGDRIHFEVEQKNPRLHKTRVDWGESAEELLYLRGPDHPNRTFEEAAARAGADYDAMFALLEAHGVGMVLVSYPLLFPDFAIFNKAMQEAVARRGIPFVDSPLALLRVPKERRSWVYMAHPGPAIYEEIARDVMARLLAMPVRSPRVPSR